MRSEEVNATNLHSKQPVGIFDSGIGGLTVASAVNRFLPQEQLVYFGDTAHLPYGDKSTAAIQSYAVKICNVLLERNCKLILIACNSASAAAYDLVKMYVGSKALVLNVIDPVVDHLREYFAGKAVGLIGTKQTILSGAYEGKIRRLNQQIQLQSVATPLLAPMIEEGFYSEKISKLVIAEYLNNEKLFNLNALVLGCTHYPLIKPAIEEYYRENNRVMSVIDSSVIVAQSVKALLQHNNLLNKQDTLPVHEFMVSDLTDSFQKSTAIFFGQELELEACPLWE